MTIISLICLICLIVSLVLSKKANHILDEYNYNYTESNYGDQLGTHNVSYRKDWGGKPPKNNVKLLQHPVALIIISHTSTLSCNSTNTCGSTVREVQAKHFEMQPPSVDIGYNFMIGGDGNIYVGRGWDIQNFHRRISIGISFIGEFNYDNVTTSMVNAADEIIKQGVQLRKLSEQYVLVGENQTNSMMFLSPGENLYKLISSWSHFNSKAMF